MSVSKNRAKKARRIVEDRRAEQAEARERESAEQDRQDDLSAEQLQVSGATLEPEEMAALTAVLAHMQAAAATEAGAEEAAEPRPGRHGPGPRGVDRTLERRRRLGLWARPGEGQWKRAPNQT